MTTNVQLSSTKTVEVADEHKSCGIWSVFKILRRPRNRRRSQCITPTSNQNSNAIHPNIEANKETQATSRRNSVLSDASRCSTDQCAVDHNAKNGSKRRRRRISTCSDSHIQVGLASSVSMDDSQVVSTRDQSPSAFSAPPVAFIPAESEATKNWDMAERSMEARWNAWIREVYRNPENQLSTIESVCENGTSNSYSGSNERVMRAMRSLSAGHAGEIYSSDLSQPRLSVFAKTDIIPELKTVYSPYCHRLQFSFEMEQGQESSPSSLNSPEIETHPVRGTGVQCLPYGNSLGINSDIFRRVNSAQSGSSVYTHSPRYSDSYDQTEMNGSATSSATDASKPIGERRPMLIVTKSRKNVRGRDSPQSFQLRQNRWTQQEPIQEDGGSLFVLSNGAASNYITTSNANISPKNISLPSNQPQLYRARTEGHDEPRHSPNRNTTNCHTNVIQCRSVMSIQRRSTRNQTPMNITRPAGRVYTSPANMPSFSDKDFTSSSLPHTNSLMNTHRVDETSLGSFVSRNELTYSSSTIPALTMDTRVQINSNESCDPVNSITSNQVNGETTR